MKKNGGIGKAYREKLGLVLNSGPKIITPDYVSETLNVSKQEAGRLLSRWHDSGWLGRIKRGTYVPIPITSKTNEAMIDEPFPIIDQIHGPGYIAGFTAIKHWDLSEQIIESLTYFTVNKVKRRDPKYGSMNLRLKTISEYKMFGLKTLWYGNKKIKISDPAKTIIDILDDPKVVGGIRIVSDILNEYLDSEYLDIELLIDYGKKMKNATIFKRLGFLLQLRHKLNSEELKKLKSLITQSYSNIDSTLDCNQLIDEWKIRVSHSWKSEYDRKK